MHDYIDLHDRDSICTAITDTLFRTKFKEPILVAPDDFTPYSKYISELRCCMTVIPLKIDNNYILICPNTQPRQFKKINNIADTIYHMYNFDYVKTLNRFITAIDSLAEYFSTHIRNGHFDRYHWDVYSDKFKNLYGRYPTPDDNGDMIRIADWNYDDDLPF